jgi:hypothetical protein
MLQVAQRDGLVRPTVSTDLVFDVQDARHLVVERALAEDWSGDTQRRVGAGVATTALLDDDDGGDGDADGDDDGAGAASDTIAVPSDHVRLHRHFTPNSLRLAGDSVPLVCLVSGPNMVCVACLRVCEAAQRTLRR